MGQRRPRRQETERIEPFGRRHSVFFQTFGIFTRGFAQMNLHGQAVFFRGAGGKRQQFGRNGIDRMAGKPFDNSFLAGVVGRQKTFGRGHFAFRLFRIEHVHFHQRHRGANPHFLYRPHGFFTVKIHVGEKDGARFDHFQYGQTAGNINVVRGQPGFNRPDVFPQPGKQRLVVAVTAENRHCRMTVGVVKGGDDRLVRAVDELVRRRFRIRRDFFKAAVFDQNVDPPVLVQNILN